MNLSLFYCDIFPSTRMQYYLIICFYDTFYDIFILTSSFNYNIHKGSDKYSSLNPSKWQAVSGTDLWYPKAFAACQTTPKLIDLNNKHLLFLTIQWVDRVCLLILITTCHMTMPDSEGGERRYLMMRWIAFSLPHPPSNWWLLNSYFYITL